MKYTAYHRTSTKDQKLDRGLSEIRKYTTEHGISLYKDKVYTDQQTGKNFHRPGYMILKEEVLEPGDVLIITEVDRLGRNKKDTLKELQYFRENDIRVMILEIPTTLTDFTAVDNKLSGMMLETINNLLIEVYATLAEAEIEKKEKRQREGMEQMKARGEWDRYGRPAVMSQKEFESTYEPYRVQRIPQIKIMKLMNMKASTFYRYRGKYYERLADEIFKEISGQGYRLNQYDQDHIKMLLNESRMTSEKIINTVIESKTGHTN